MKKVLFGAILGAAAATVLMKMNEQGKFDCLYDEANKLIDKTKRNAKRAVEYTQEEAQYLAEKARAKADHYEKMAREKANQFADKVEQADEKVADKIRGKASDKPADNTCKA
ncbi:MAG: hypothetical protein LUD68_08920 [Rikenellaceae bacterium]|nr:hypothetical protein [Rikenellaceae bacterium]